MYQGKAWAAAIVATTFVEKKALKICLNAGRGLQLIYGMVSGQNSWCINSCGECWSMEIGGRMGTVTFGKLLSWKVEADRVLCPPLMLSQKLYRSTNAPQHCPLSRWIIAVDRTSSELPWAFVSEALWHGALTFSKHCLQLECVLGRGCAKVHWWKESSVNGGPRIQLPALNTGNETLLTMKAAALGNLKVLSGICSFTWF